MMSNRATNISNDYQQSAKRKLITLTIVFIIVFLFSFSLGRYSVPLREIPKIILSKIFPIKETWDHNMAIAILNIRLPRILLASMVGSCLAVAGTSYQSVFYNPMASPSILGASAGAAFGAALAILLGMSKHMLILSSFVFSLITIFLVLFISKRARGDQIINILLAGVMISSLFSAATSYIKLVADPTNQLPAITYWLMGSFNGVTFKDVGFSIIPMLVGVIPLLLLRWRINLLTLGDEEAKTMGVNTDRLRLVLILCATLITAASVAVSGMIGWVGLVIPHLGRKLVGNDCRYLMFSSLVMGATFLLIVDNVSRNLTPVEIPIGILTAFIGAPFFVYLMTRKESTI